MVELPLPIFGVVWNIALPVIWSPGAVRSGPVKKGVILAIWTFLTTFPVSGARQIGILESLGVDRRLLTV